jgi:hypothetical protein
MEGARLRGGKDRLGGSRWSNSQTIGKRYNSLGKGTIDQQWHSMSGPVEEAGLSSGSPPRRASRWRQAVSWVTSSMAVKVTALAADLEWPSAARHEPEGDMWLCGQPQWRAAEPAMVARREPKDE